MKEAILYKKLENNKAQCNVCNHRCIILENKRGFCQTRENQKGILYSLAYGKAIASNIDPIEKKPLYHFLPGSKIFSIATVGCNFKCFHCQNWQISQAPIHDQKSSEWGENLSSEKIIEQAIKTGCKSIAYTYTEPTIFLEYALETMKLAKKANLKNVWVTNGYFTQEVLELIAPYLDAVNVDLKSFSEKFYQKYCQTKLFPVLENLKRLKEKKIWLEVTTLIIPGLNDSEKELREAAQFIANELGANTPWHLSRFFSVYKAIDFPITSLEILIKARQIGLDEGLMYVYIGNVSDHPGDDTYCSQCETLLIERSGYQIKRFDENGKCRKCGKKIDLVE